MDIISSLLDIINEPTIIFGDQDQFLSNYVASSLPASWDLSPLNPKNRIESLDNSNCKWRIDGCARFGTQFYAIPTHVPDLVPIRIDVFIPSQDHHPFELRDALDSSYSLFVKGAEVANMGIAKHVCRALDYHSERDPEFWKTYQNLPFGSRILIDDITSNIKDMSLSFLPAHSLEKKLLSIKSLQRLWASQVPPEGWPSTIDISELRLLHQLHDSISLINIPSHSSTEKYIFKSSTTDPKYLYHELLLLLTLPSHPNIISKPLFLVTKKSSFGGKNGVCGFILPYHPIGSLRDILPSRASTGTLTFKQQLKWSQQITSAIIHIREKSGTFYSDLRPDNVLLTPLKEGDGEDVILVDFEQRGNWREWCAPEVLYPIYLDQLRSPSVNLSPHWENILQSHPAISIETTNENVGWTGKPTWLALDPCEQENAEVYNLGLFLYCVFEGQCSVQKSLLNEWPYNPTIDFPEFRRTPEKLREIIRRCTIDSPEWNREPEHKGGGYGGVVRRRGKVYPRRQYADSDVRKEIWDSARRWWEEELWMMETFLKDNSPSQGREIRRPTLREVLAFLESAEEIERLA
jgi:hypothetical protein